MYDVTKPVKVYRNLGNRTCLPFSVMQGGLVVGHTDQLMLRDVACVVSEKGNARVRRENRKYVHAFLVGYVIPSGMGTAADREDKMDRNSLCYKPYRWAWFHHEDTPNKDVKGAYVVKIRKGRVFTYYSY